MSLFLTKNALNGGLLYREADKSTQMEFPIFLLLFGAGFVCGGLNAVAGGATLLGFPVLLSVGLPPPVANASNFVATVPGYAAAIPSCLRELRRMMRQSVIVQIISATAGATLGSILLVLGDSIFLRSWFPGFY